MILTLCKRFGALLVPVLLALMTASVQAIAQTTPGHALRRPSVPPGQHHVISLACEPIGIAAGEKPAPYIVHSARLTAQNGL